MTSSTNSALCTEVLEHLAEVVDGTAEAHLYEHLADCDACRDARHEAEQARAHAAAAGLDHRTPTNLEARVLAALDEQVEDAEPKADDEPEPKAATEAPAPKRKAAPPPLSRDRRLTAFVAVAAVAAAVAVVLRSGSDHSPGGPGGAWSGKLERASSSTGHATVLACSALGKDCSPVATGAPLLAGARVKTDATTRAELRLADGSLITLDRSTELSLATDGARRARLLTGGLVADITHQKSEARFELPAGAVTVHGTKFALRAQGRSAAVDVARGVVTLSDGGKNSVRVGEGETGRLEAGQGPTVAFSSSLGESLGWSDETFGEEKPELLATRGLGELKAKKPGQDSERTHAVTLASHRVHVRIAGAMARTEIEEVFENQSDDVLEGIYRFPLPPDAQIERLALDVDGKLEEGAFVDRERAAAIFRGAIVNAAPKQPRPLEEIVWVPGPWRDPALLEWQRGGRFELRIFPIPKHGSRRVVLAYTEVVKASGGARRYTYPLAYDPSGTTRVRSFGVDLEVRGHDAAFGVRPVGYTLEPAPSADGVSALHFNAEAFAPAGDLGVEYTLPGAASELTAWSYYSASGGAPSGSSTRGVATPDERSPYVALALRPRLPPAAHESGRSLAIVVDSSRSMLGEGYERASALAVRLVRELDESDRVTVLACGADCRVLPGDPLTPGSVAASEVGRFLRGITPEDASDLVGAVDRALGSLRSGAGRTRRVIYLGDGAPTVGQVRPGSIERAIARSIARVPASVVAVAVGADADQATLGALARGGDGVMLPYAPGRTSAEMTYAVLGASYGNALANVEVTLPEGLRAMAPTRLASIPAGGEALVLARMDNLEASGVVVLRGKVSGKPFEQRYRLDVRASEAAGNAFVPRLYAAARLGDLEREGTDAAKAEAIALSTRFSVASRYTSLLVLESQAMLTAFGLQRANAGTTFTGEEEAQSTSADGSEDVGADELANGSGDLGSASVQGGSLGGLGSTGRSVGGPSAPQKAPSASTPRAKAFDVELDDRRVSPSPTSASAAAAPPAPVERNEESMRPRGAAADSARDVEKKRSSQALLPEPFEPSQPFVPRERPRRMIPMRRIWERHGEFFPDRRVPSGANESAIESAAQDVAANENRREAVKKLFTLLLQAGDIERAASVAERWSTKEPLDAEAITARADVLAARGSRSEAMRALGSVLDVRPGDVAGEKRLARLERWAGRPALGCRFSIAIAEMRPADAQLLADAVRCARETYDSAAADELLLSAPAAARDTAERLLAGARPDDTTLRGDLRLEATWLGGVDLDLALIDPDGHRVSWLGAPTRGVISARDATSLASETLALSGGKPGEYAVEIVSSGTGSATGSLTLTVAGTTRRVPFSLDGNRTRLGIVKVTMVPRLVPL